MNHHSSKDRTSFNSKSLLPSLCLLYKKEIGQFGIALKKGSFESNKKKITSHDDGTPFIRASL